MDVAPLLVLVIVAVVAVLVTMFVTMFVPMVLTIVWNVGIGVPVMPDEVNRLAASVVLAAVMAPVALIAWPHMQIDRRRQHAALNAYAHYGRAIDKTGRRCVADVDPSVKARVAQIDGGRHLRQRRAAGC